LPQLLERVAALVEVAAHLVDRDPGFASERTGLQVETANPVQRAMEIMVLRE